MEPTLNHRRRKELSFNYTYLDWPKRYKIDFSSKVITMRFSVTSVTLWCLFLELRQCFAQSLPEKQDVNVVCRYPCWNVWAKRIRNIGIFKFICFQNSSPVKFLLFKYSMLWSFDRSKRKGYYYSKMKSTDQNLIKSAVKIMAVFLKLTLRM